MERGQRLSTLESVGIILLFLFAFKPSSEDGTDCESNDPKGKRPKVKIHDNLTNSLRSWHNI